MRKRFFIKLIRNFSGLSLWLLSWFFAQKAKALNFAQTSGLAKTATNAGYPEGLNASPEEAAIQVISFILSFIGVLFMILMIYGGFIWMTARGNEKEVERAKKIITSGAIGLIIVFGAYAISYFIINFFSESSLK